MDFHQAMANESWSEALGAGRLRLRQRILRGATELAVGQVGEQGLVFLRNLIVARLIGPEDFGVAATFAITVSLLQMISDLALDKLIIQARNGDQPELRDTLHSLMVARGLLLASLIFLSAGPIAQLFNVPEAKWAYQWLALTPLIRSFGHLDIKRFQRQFRYRPEILATVSSHAVGFVVAAVLAYWLRDYSAMLWSTIAHAIAGVIASHLLASERYRLGMTTSEAKRALVYGWPLLINGAIIFVSVQGDRLLIGASFGVRELAIYSVASMVLFAPSTALMKIKGSIYLPILSAVQDQSSRFRERYMIIGAFTASITAMFVLPFILLGSDIVALVFGPSYKGPTLLMGWLAIAAGARVFRAWPVSAGLAVGDTKSLMYANLVRLPGFAVAALTIQAGYGPVEVAASITLGEIAASVFAIIRANRYNDMKHTAGLLLFLGIMMTFFAALGLASFYAPKLALLDAALMTLGLMALSLLFVAAIASDARSYLLGIMSERRSD